MARWLTWSRPAAFRALRATLVVPVLFWLCFKGLDNLQMASFAAFGGFATLVMASFGGTRLDRIRAHLSLALVGTALLTIGTLVSGDTVLAIATTALVAFAVLYAGVLGPTQSTGATAALLAYVLPAASPGNAAMIPDRVAGWWLASVVGTLAVLTLSPAPAADQVCRAAAGLAEAVARQLRSALEGLAPQTYRRETLDAKHSLMDAFSATPYRPTGVTDTDRALDELVGLLEWTAVLTLDGVCEDPAGFRETEGGLLAASADTLTGIAAALRGSATPPAVDCVLDQLRASEKRVATTPADDEVDYRRRIHASFHARTIASSVVSAADRTMVVAGLAKQRDITARRLTAAAR